MNTPTTRLHALCASLSLVATLITFGGVEAMARHAAPDAAATTLAAKVTVVAVKA